MKKTPKNFAIWTALNSDVSFFSNTPSYYGGSTQTEAQKLQLKQFCEKYYIKYDPWWHSSTEIKKQFDAIGIDFDNCTIPKSDTACKFNGTEADSSVIDIVTGVLVLKDGQRIDYYAECKLDMNQFSAMQAFFEAAE